MAQGRTRVTDDPSPEGGARMAPGGLHTVGKAFALLEILVAEREASAARLAELIDEPRSSVYRILASLQHLGHVEPGSRRGLFRPGSSLLRLSGAVLSRLEEREAALPVLEWLNAKTGETVHLGVRRGYQAVFIERLHGERMHSFAINLGGVLPLHVGASPRALLAAEPDAFVDAYLAATPIQQWTPSSPATADEVRARIAEIRSTGVSISDEDVVIGVATVGAAIRDHRGRVRAALAFNLLPEALRADRVAYVELAREAARRASTAFGYSEPPLATTDGKRGR